MNMRKKILLVCIALLTLACLPELSAARSTGNSGTPAVELQQQPEPAANDTTGAETAEEKLEQLQNLISFSVILLIFGILLATYFIVRLLVSIIDNLSERATRYRLALKRLVPVARILIWSLSIYIIIAGIIDPPLETVIAVTASIGIAVGLASQDILKNYIWRVHDNSRSPIPGW